MPGSAEARAPLEELVAAACAGDAEALGQLLEALRDDVYGLALRMLWHPEDAEDATQEILIKVMTKLSSFRGQASVRTWAYRVAVNLLLDRRRSGLERQQLTFEAFGQDLAEGLVDPSPDLAPSAGVLAEEVKRGCTMAMLTCLDRDHRMAWILGEVFGVTSEDGGWICGISAAAYRKRLSRARDRLRRFVEGHCGLVDATNSCRCHRRIEAAVGSGRVVPDGLLFVDESEALGPSVREMEGMHTAASLLRDHPDYRAPHDVAVRIGRLLESATLRLLDGR